MADLLAIMAHPDDAELLCGGTLIRAADQGRSTAVLDLTAGESGSWGSAGDRSKEAAAAAHILGLTSRENAALPDGALVNTPETRANVAGLIRHFRPRTVILHWPEARHPDHRAASQLGYDACFLAGLRNAPIDRGPHATNVAWGEGRRPDPTNAAWGGDGEAHRPHKVLYAIAYHETQVKPTFVVDITDQIERKLDAIFAFGSQFEGRTAMGDVFGGGERGMRDQLLAHAAHYGSLIRRPYGEPYWTRETMRVDDVVGLAVNSI